MSNYRVDRICPVCKSSYTADPKRLKFGRQTTCSRDCSYRQRSKKISKKVELVCATCKKHYFRSPSSIRYKVNCCSRKCAGQARTAGLIPHIVTRKYTYTEDSKARLIATARSPKGKRVLHPLVCHNCRKTFEDPHWGRMRKSGVEFCSLKCCNEYRRGDKNPAWRGGHPEYYGSNWRSIRREVRERDNYTCQRCNKKPTRLPDVHHIKPIGTFDTPEEGNYSENLISLCHSCHMFVEWHGIDFEWPKQVIMYAVAEQNAGPLVQTARIPQGPSFSRYLPSLPSRYERCNPQGSNLGLRS